MHFPNSCVHTKSREDEFLPEVIAATICLFYFFFQRLLLHLGLQLLPRKPMRCIEPYDRITESFGSGLQDHQVCL